MNSKQEGVIYKSGMVYATAKKMLSSNKYHNYEKTLTHLLPYIYYHVNNQVAWNVPNNHNINNVLFVIIKRATSSRRL